VLPRRSWAAAIARAGVRIILRLFHLPLTVHGTENIPKTGPCVIVPNHSSYPDGLVVKEAARGDLVRSTDGQTPSVILMAESIGSWPNLLGELR
jgi:1-acyl-sn-glycerol-3-phosphate acyltransferase